MKKTASIAIYLDVRNKKSDETYPVTLRITFQRKQVYYVINYKDKGISLTKEEFIQVMDNMVRLGGTLASIRKEINAEKVRAEEVVNSMDEFSFKAFESKYLFKAKAGDVATVFDEVIREKKQEGRIGTASSYQCSLNSLQKFFAKQKNVNFDAVEIKFTDITEGNLEKYIHYLRKDKCTDATAGIYLRNLRAIYRKGIKDGYVKQDRYPFGREKFEIPTGAGRNIALNMDELKSIYHCPTGPAHDLKGNINYKAWAKDMFLFTYLCNGINLKDIARLKYGNIKNGEIVFIRAKTEFTRKHGKAEIVVRINSDIQRIIDTWGTKPSKADNFIFGILDPAVDPERERMLVQNATSVINDHLKKIAVELGITKPVTTYTARHTYASLATAFGVPLAYLSQDLGHTDTRTTQGYISQIETDITQAARARMLDFSIDVKQAKSS